MMHNRAGRKLRRTTSHRLAMFSNQLDSLMTHERIQTTLTKAKELRPLAEKLITAAKNDGIAARRKVAQWIPDRSTVKKVFETIAPRFVDRPGGYTRILRLGARKGDAAEAAILAFVDYRFEPTEKGPRKAEAARGGQALEGRKEGAEEGTQPDRPVQARGVRRRRRPPAAPGPRPAPSDSSASGERGSRRSPGAFFSGR